MFPLFIFKNVYWKISQSHLHKAVAHPTILPSAEIVGIMVQQEDVSNRWLVDVQYQPLSSYQSKVLHEKYHIPNPKVFMTTQWINNERAKHGWYKFMKGWVSSGKTNRATSKHGYKESILVKHI